MKIQLDPFIKKEILKLARTAIEVYLESNTEPPVPPDDFWKEPAGAFVTLTIEEDLRGCIGYVEAIYPLGVTIIQAAIAAAFKDPRFQPLSRPELDSIHIEVSLLSPVRQIQNVEEVEIGVHGLIISLGRFRGLLLPQVAVEYKWDRETFLQHTCQKAGLPSDTWKNPDARIEVFSAEIFGESS